MKFIAFTGIVLISCFILSVVVAVGVYTGIECFFKNKLTTEEKKEIE